MSFQEDDEEELGDSELPDAADMDDSDSTDIEACPICGKQIYEQSQVCPYCGNFVSPGRSRSRKPLWIVVGVIVCLAVVFFLWLR
jgi:predicted nucleic acid-binding Zn ribbon protein